MITTILNTIPDEPFIVSILLLHIKAFLLLSVAYIISESLWRHSAAQRFVVFACGFFAILCIPVFKTVAAFQWQTDIGIQRSVPLQTALTTKATASNGPLGIHQVFFILYTTGVLWHLSRLILSLCSVVLLMRHNRVAEFRGQTYYLNHKIAAPFSFGAIRAVIVLPYEAIHWDNETLDAVLSHEQAHCHRHDWLMFLFAKLICAVFWLAPWVWQAERKLRRLAENACDDAALRHGNDNTRYATILLETAKAHSARCKTGTVAQQLVPAFHGSELRQRIEHVLQDDQNRQRSRGKTIFSNIVLFTLLSFLLGSVNATASWQNQYATGIPLLRHHTIQERAADTNAANSHSANSTAVNTDLIDVYKPQRPHINSYAWQRSTLPQAKPLALTNTPKLAVNFKAPPPETLTLDSNVAVQGRVPRVMASVNYPKAALNRGIEGYVIVQFTIDETGQVRNPRVLQSQPGHIFDSSALEAIKRFKYTPLEIGGIPTPVAGVLNRFVFQLSDKPIKTPPRSVPFKGTTLIALQNSS